MVAPINVLARQDGSVKTVVTLTSVLVILVKIMDTVLILKVLFHAHVLMDGMAKLVKLRQSVTELHVKMEVRGISLVSRITFTIVKWRIAGQRTISMSIHGS
jgi:hypothetical protein